MAIDLGAALLEKDYNEELRNAMEHYRKKGKSQGLWGQLGGMGAQGLAVALLSGGMSVPAMALAGGLANAAGTYLGGQIGAAGYDDYDAKFGQETIGDLSSTLSDSLLTSALSSGITSAASSAAMGLGAGDAAAGKISEEAMEAGLTDAAKKSLTSLEFDTFADPGKITSAKHFMTAPDGTITPFTNKEAIYENIGTQNLSPDYKDYTFSSTIGDTTYDFEWSRDLYEAHASDRATGARTAQDLLRKTDLEGLGLDPQAHQDLFAPGTTQDELMSFYMDTQKSIMEPGFRKEAALRGLDAEGNFLVDDPADLGPETFSKRMQDWRILGWDEMGGFDNLLGDFGFHFEEQPGTPVFDPVTQTWSMTPATSPSVNPWQWAKDNPLMTALGGTGLLWSLLNQD